MFSKSSISVFFPAFNDEKTIGGLVENALQTLPKMADDFEVIIVNDGSTDGTAKVLADLAEKYDVVRIVSHESNQGYGAALRSGLAAAEKDLVFYTDGDGQYDVRELTKLFPLLKEQIDVVNGFKIERADKIHRRAIGSFYQRVARLMFSLPIRDVDCDFRLIRRKCLQDIELRFSSGAICVELVKKLALQGCIFAEVPVNHFPRLHGRSQFFKIGRITRTLFDFAVLWWQLKLTKKRTPNFILEKAEQIEND